MISTILDTIIAVILSGTGDPESSSLPVPPSIPK